MVEYPITTRLLDRLANHCGYVAKHHAVWAEEVTEPWLCL
jgi:hypothetical protein